MKLLLVIDVADDVADAYEDFTVDYDLRGIPKDNQTVNESIKFVEDFPLKPMPDIKTKEAIKLANMINPKATFQEFADGWNACLEEIQK